MVSKMIHCRMYVLYIYTCIYSDYICICKSNMNSHVQAWNPQHMALLNPPFFPRRFGQHREGCLGIQEADARFGLALLRCRFTMKRLRIFIALNPKPQTWCLDGNFNHDDDDDDLTYYNMGIWSIEHGHSGCDLTGWPSLAFWKGEWGIIPL